MGAKLIIIDTSHKWDRISSITRNCAVSVFAFIKQFTVGLNLEKRKVFGTMLASRKLVGEKKGFVFCILYFGTVLVIRKKEIDNSAVCLYFVFCTLEPCLPVKRRR